MMTQSQRSLLSILKAESFKKHLSEQYLVVNLVFIGLILLILVYSAVFSPEINNYPVVCIHEKITGMPCPSCGLSHSFSYLVRGNLAEAVSWNTYGLRIFIFFIAQLLIRIVFSVNYLKYNSIRRSIVFFDAAGSLVLLLIAFFPFLQQLFVVISM